MRTLILSCNTGEGHNACARAIKEYYDQMESPCQIEDALAFVSEEISKVVAKGHVFIYRKCAHVFEWGYEYAENHPERFDEESHAYHFLARGAEDLSRFITEGGFDTVICTHPFSALMMTEVVRVYHLPVHTAFAATDYTCCPGVSQSDLDLYFIPAPALVEEFSRQGLSQEKIISSGIPVRQEFYQEMDKEKAKTMAGVSPAHRHILMACGSMGCGPLEELSQQLAQQMPEDTELTVVCGTNEKLEETMHLLHDEDHRVHVRGFEKNMPLLMDSADVYITKPGGLSSTEAMTKQIPMVLVNTVGGCESHNLDFVLKYKLGVTGDTVGQLTDACLNLLRNLPEDQNGEILNSARIIYETMERSWSSVERSGNENSCTPV